MCLCAGIRGLAAPSSWRRTTLQFGSQKQSVTVSHEPLRVRPLLVRIVLTWAATAAGFVLEPMRPVSRRWLAAGQCICGVGHRDARVVRDICDRVCATCPRHSRGEPRAARACAQARSALGCCGGLRWGTTCWLQGSTRAALKSGKRIPGALAARCHVAARAHVAPTHCRTCQNWSTGTHALTDAAWSADESVVLIALDESSQLGVLHLVGSAPSLLAHLLPLDLPDLPAPSGGVVTISSLALDSKAGKLAVACTAADAGAAAVHAVCLYALQASPVYLAKSVGRVLPPADVASSPPQCKLQVALRPGLVDGQNRSVIAITWHDGSVALASV